MYITTQMNHWKGKTTQLSSLKSSWHQPHHQYFEAPAGTSPPCPPLSQPSHRGYGRCSPPPSSWSPPQSKPEPFILSHGKAHPLPPTLGSTTNSSWPCVCCLLGVERKRWKARTAGLLVGAAVALPHGVGGNLTPAATTPHQFKVVHLPPVVYTLQYGDRWPKQNWSTCFNRNCSLLCSFYNDLSWKCHYPVGVFTNTLV